MTTRSPRAVALVAAAALALLACAFSRESGDAATAPSSGGNPYSVLGVPSDASKAAITKAYRILALKFHPDRNRGDTAAADSAFATISHAYGILTDPEKRDVYDRLGEEGLERLRDGDPSVSKDWLPPDEILRRLHDDGDEPWLQSLVTSSFSSFGARLDGAVARAARWAAWLGLDATPSVVISASDDASGAALASGDRARADVTFKLSLSGKSFDFTEADVMHTGCTKARFLGMKTTFYLQCAHAVGQALTVSVAANAFTVAGQKGTSRPSEVFHLTMV